MLSHMVHTTVLLTLTNIIFAVAVAPTIEDGHHLGASLLSKEEPNNTGMPTAMTLEVPKVPEWEQYATCAGIVLGVGLVIAGMIIGIKGALGKEKAPKDLDEVSQRREKLRTEFLDEIEALKKTEEALTEKENETDNVQAAAAGKTDYQALLMEAADKVRAQIAPKLEKEGEVRSLLENRAMQFKDKAKSLVVSELNGTCGAVLQAMDAEEATLLLDWNQAIKAAFPPLSILIAGLLSPTLLTFAFWGYFAQCFIVLLPVLVLCIWAKVVDEGTICSIPTMHIWIEWNIFLSFIMVISQLALMVQILVSKSRLAARRAEIEHKMEAASHKRKQGEGPGIGEMRDVFISHSVLLQQAVILEDQIRSSVFVNIAGIGTIFSILTTIWTTVIVFGWTFVPGVTAFHPKAKDVARDVFCGSWASVFTARLTCVMSMLFLVINIAAVVAWFWDKFGSFDIFAQSLLQKAKNIDKSMMGIPVVETIVKALVLRGHGTDFTSARLAVAMYEKNELETQKADLSFQLADVEGQIDTCKSRAALLMESAAGSTQKDIEQMIKTFEEGSIDEDMKEWKRLGVQAADTAEAKAALAANIQEAQTEELQKLIDMVMHAADSIRNSETAQSAMAGAEHLKELAEEESKKAYEALQQSELGKQALEKAQAVKRQIEENETVKQAVAQGQAVAQQVADSEAVKQAVAQGKAAAQQVADSEAVQQAIAQGKAAAQQVADSEAVQRAVAQGKAAAQQVAAQGKAAAQQVADSEAVQQAIAQGKAAAKQVADSEAVQQAVAQGKAAAQQVAAQGKAAAQQVADSEAVQQAVAQGKAAAQQVADSEAVQQAVTKGKDLAQQASETGSK